MKSFKYLGSLVTNQNSIQEEIKCRVKTGNSCYSYYSIQTLLSIRLLSKNLKIKKYKTIILPVVLYGYEAWFLTLMVLENRVQRRIFGRKRDETGKWRRLYNEEPNSLYRSSNIVRAIKSRIVRMERQVARMEEGRSAFKILTGKPIRRRSLERPTRRWKDNNRMGLKETGINAGNWVNSVQDRDYWRVIVNVALNLRVHRPWG